jgi:hypothetical protein
MRARGRSVGLAAALGAVLVAALVGAQPARSLGPAVAGVGPASAGVPGGTVVTTTSGPTTTAGPTTSTVPTTTLAPIAILASWMLDEASGTRVNAKGDPTMDLAVNGSVTQDTTNKIQGVAAAKFIDNSTYLSVTAAAISNLVSPLSVGCWIRPTASPSLGFFLGRWGTHGFLLDQEGTNARFYIRVSSTNYQTSGGAFGGINAFHHVVGTYAHPSMIVYTDGQNTGTATAGAALPTESVQFQLGTSNAGFPYAGQLDECFIASGALAPTQVCRICSCGLDGSLCTCSGASYTSSGRNASNCGSCTMTPCNAPGFS